MRNTNLPNGLPAGISDALTEAFAGMRGGSQPAAGRLEPFDDFASNPGALSAYRYIPADLAPCAPLVVVLHGCTQHAQGFDRGSGWSHLADRYGFALLVPEQTRGNNPNFCFNWFQPKDTARGEGEAASIASMIEAMVTRHGLDHARVHITGLSAGGAMTASMLAAYPDLFASGAIIAGLPHGIARNVPQALDAMAGRSTADAGSLGDHVRAASEHQGPWPRISVWQGDADHTVVAANGDAVAAQWRSVHGLEGPPTLTEGIGPHRRSAWTDAEGRELVELYAISGMGHGVPLRPGTSDGEAGTAGAHMLDVGLDSTGRIAAFFGLTEVKGAKASAAKSKASTSRKATAKVVHLPPKAEPKPEPETTGVQAVIEKALRAAGLM